ncbi:MAG: AIR synthase family protein [Chloroflexi bacterium]|nr:AIR synthase family protein [Chloroflexota bacterium]
MLASGKLPSELLARLLQVLPITDPQLLLGPAVGEDAAVIDFSPGQDRLLVVKSDPITFATEEIGYYAVNVCANDLAVTGAKPRFYLPTVLLPAGQTDAHGAEQIFAQIADSCRRLGIVVAGGHSEITPTVNQPVVAGTMLGEVLRSQVVRSGGCRPGDLVLMAGAAPVEGTSIIARAKRQVLLARGWSSAELDQAANFLHEPGISILQPAQLASQRGLVTAMHDPTEGGVATALLELSMAAGVGLEIDLDAIAIPALSRRLCAEFDLNPLGVIASGALLATAAPAQAEVLLALWKTHGWPRAIIGQVVAPDAGLRARQGEHQAPFPQFAVDEITKLWA